MNDSCRAIDLVLRKGQPGEAYNIGGSCEKKNIDVVTLIGRILKDLVAKNKDLSPSTQDLRPKQGLERTIGWYLGNQDWVENVVTGEYREYYERVYGRGVG